LADNNALITESTHPFAQPQTPYLCSPCTLASFVSSLLFCRPDGHFYSSLLRLLLLALSRLHSHEQQNVTRDERIHHQPHHELIAHILRAPWAAAVGYRFKERKNTPWQLAPQLWPQISPVEHVLWPLGGVALFRRFWQSFDAAFLLSVQRVIVPVLALS